LARLFQHCFYDKNQLVQFAADIVVATGNKSMPAPEMFNMVLTGGGSIVPVYSELASRVSEAFWKKTIFFWGDERCVPPDSHESNYYLAKSILLGPLGVDESQVRRIAGELGAQTAADLYNLEIDRIARLRMQNRQNQIFDLTFLSIGEDGHIASLFPGQAALDSAQRFAIPVTAVYKDRPAQRVSLTSEALIRSRKIVLIAAGEKKINAIQRMLEPDMNDDLLPAKRILSGQSEIYILTLRE